MILPTYFLRLKKRKQGQESCPWETPAVLTLMSLRKIFIFGSTCHSFFNLDLHIGKRKGLKMPDKETIGKLKLMCVRPILWILKPCFGGTQTIKHRQTELEIVSRVRNERKKNKGNRGRWKQF